ncbi:MAG: hypothetical protein QW156_04395 [Candidatus Aenigmatarchaeota archaeon]
MKNEYAIPFKIDDKVQGVIFITESQYRKLKRLKDGSPFKLHLEGVKGDVQEREG